MQPPAEQNELHWQFHHQSFGGVGIRQKINNEEGFEKMGTLLVGEGCGRSDCKDDSQRDGSCLATLPLR
jgi:hypothetical protein